MIDEAYREAEERIAVALRESATELNLSFMSLTNLPDSLGQLTQLQSLYLSGNQLSALPDSLGQLTQLQSLDLQYNQLSALPESLGQLTQLQSLDLAGNQLTTLPEWLGQLTQLQSLDLSENQLSALPDSLGQLIKLEKLNLSFNLLKELPTSIGKLENLSILELGNFGGLKIDVKYLLNSEDFLGRQAIRRQKIIALLDSKARKQLDMKTDLLDLKARNLIESKVAATENKEKRRKKKGYASSHHANLLSDLPISLANLKNLRELSLSNLPLNPELAAAYEQGLDAVKAYLHAKAEQQITLDEAKLILIGEGGVGKTSLLGALRGDEWVENRATTHGVEVKVESLKLTDTDSQKTITFNCWDFGGQNIYRHTHQLYFTAPAVYLAVWNPRLGSEQCAVAEWVKMVKQRAYDETRPDQHPHILIVATHRDSEERLDYIDKQALRDEFGELIVGFYHVDSKTGNDMDVLKTAIAQQAAAIPSVGREVPKSWKDVLDALRNRSEQDAFISYKQFKDFCRPRGVSYQLASTYATILNELGHIIYYHNDSKLQDTVILKAEWLSKAMSYVLEDKTTKNNYGLVTHHHLSNIWNDETHEDRYPPTIHEVFRRLMYKFDLAYQVTLQEVEAKPKSLIAQLVPFNRRNNWQTVWTPQLDEHNSQRTQVCRIVDASTGRTTEVEGLIYRLIVRLHRYSLGKDNHNKSQHWKTGMILEDGFNGRALLEAKDGDIYVTVRAAYPEHFLHLLCEEVRWLVESFWKGLECRLFVPCLAPCNGLHERASLLAHKQEGIDKIYCSMCKTFYPIDSLLATAQPKPAWTEAFTQLTNNQQQILNAVNDNYASLNSQLRAVMSQIDEQFTALLTALTDPAKDGPRLFSLEPAKTRFLDLKPNWVTQKFHLTLWCEHARLPLPVLDENPKSGVYEIELNREWLQRAAPLIKTLSTTLSLALPIAAAANKLVDDALLKPFETQLESAKTAAETVISASEQVDEWLVSDDQLQVDSNSQQVIRAQGSMLRELHALLKAKDPKQRFGGLVRVQNKKREFLWVHRQFVQEY